MTNISVSVLCKYYIGDRFLSILDWEMHTFSHLYWIMLRNIEIIQKIHLQQIWISITSSFFLKELSLDVSFTYLSHLFVCCSQGDCWCPRTQASWCPSWLCFWASSCWVSKKSLATTNIIHVCCMKTNHGIELRPQMFVLILLCYN